MLVRFRRFLFFYLLWWIITEGGGPVFFGAVIAAGAVAAAEIRPLGEFRWRLGGFLRFVPFFLWQSARGGFDVACRALRPNMALEPALVSYPLTLKTDAAKIFLVNTVSLLPGTFSADLQDSHLTIHVLDAGQDWRRGLIQVEKRVADLFGELRP